MAKALITLGCWKGTKQRMLPTGVPLPEMGWGSPEVQFHPLGIIQVAVSRGQLRVS